MAINMPINILHQYSQWEPTVTICFLAVGLHKKMLMPAKIFVDRQLSNCLKYLLLVKMLIFWTRKDTAEIAALFYV